MTLAPKILVLTDLFERGGLEEHILSQARQLSQRGVALVLATGSSKTHVPRDVFAAQLTDLALGPNATLTELRAAIDQIVQFTQSHNVTHIHAHPCYSFNIGFLVAHIARLPFVTTVHGPWSLVGAPGCVSELILREGVLRGAARTFCVSQETQMLVRGIGGRGVLLPNAAMPARAEPKSGFELRKWMWAGRLDDEKVVGVLDLISKLNGIDCELHIYGEGPARGAIENLATANEEIGSRIRLMGWQSNISQLYPKYDIVAGMGRVVIEAAACNSISLLVGYDGVKGFVLGGDIETMAYANFSGRGLKTLSVDAFHSALRVLPDVGTTTASAHWVSEHRNEAAIWKYYLDEIRDLSPLNSQFATDVIEIIRYHGNPEEAAWTSPALFRTLAGVVGTTGMVIVEQIERKMDRQIVEEVKKLAEASATQQAYSLKELQDRVELLAREKEGSVCEALAAKAEIARVQGEYANALEIVNRLKAEATALSAERDGAVEVAGSRRAKIELYLAERDSVSDALRSLRFEFQTVTAEREHFREALEQARRALADLERDRDELAATVLTAKAELNNLMKLLSEERDATLDLERGLGSQIDELRQEQEAAGKSLRELQTRSDALAAENAHTAKENDALRSELASATSSRDLLAQEEQTLRRRLEEICKEREGAILAEQMTQVRYSELYARYLGVIELSNSAMASIEDLLKASLAKAV